MGKMVVRLCLLGVLLSMAGKIQAQTLNVANVAFTCENNQVIVTYDLVGKRDSKYTIGLLLSCDYGQTFSIIPRHVRGAVGEKAVRPGSKRRIVWEYLKDFPDGLAGDGYVFAVEVMESQSKAWWPYLAAGVVVGGTAAVVLSVVSALNDGAGSTGIHIVVPAEIQ